MKMYIRVLISLVSAVSMLQAAAFEKDVKSRAVDVHLSSEKPLSTGSNTLVLTIYKEGKIAEDVKVRVKAFMPAMPGMPAMEYEADALYLENGKYETKLNLSMGGTWQLHIFITPKEGKRLRVKTSVDF